MEHQTPISTTIAQYEDRICGKFKPDKRFYETVGINSKRFYQLVRGEKEPVASELVNLSKFFSVPLTTLCAK